MVNGTVTGCKNDKLISENIIKLLEIEHPVVSSLNCHTKTLSKYADFHLQLIVKNIPSDVRGTTDFLQELDKVKTF